MAKNTIYSDSQIVELYWLRDEMAISHTQAKYGGLCYTISQQILRDLRDVEECVNDTYLATWNTIPPQKPNSLKYYVCKLIRRISLNKIEYNYANKRDVRKTISYEEISCELDEVFSEQMFTAEDATLTAVINEYLETLPIRNRDVLVLRFWMCYSVLDIARQTGVKENTVKTILSREIKNMKQYLIEKGVYADAANT